MGLGSSQTKSGLKVIASAVLLCIAAGCGNSSIVGKWRMSGDSNAIVWEFKSNGAVLVGNVSGTYKFGDQDRIKIQTPFATSVYQLKISGDQMVLQEPGGSTLEFTRIKEAQR
jgi:hypothetical protein